MERSRDWMDQAEGDLEHAQSDMERGFYDWACFSSQQAAEKAVFHLPALSSRLKSGSGSGAGGKDGG